MDTMRLLKVRVRDFRSVEDSEVLSLDDVTCLVGKNESGKTALLKALYKLKPDEASEVGFEPAKDYPKRKWRPGSPIPQTPPAIETTWQLSSADVAAIEADYGVGALKSRALTISRTYGTGRRLGFQSNHQAVLRHFVSEAKLTAKERKALSASPTPEAAVKNLAELSTRSPAQDKLLTTLKARFPQGVENALVKALDLLVPTFLYFDEYLTLPGTVSINEVNAREHSKTLTEKDRVFLALLSLAGTSLDRVQNAGTFEEFNSSLRAVSNQVTDQIFEYWSQNKHLDVDIRIDHARASDPPPFNSGWVCRTRIDNKRHRADTDFDDRSRGFVWFFSFLVWFYQLRQLYGRKLVILLDEPGLSLHARAQGDLLRYINEQLRPNYQVIYTTHSPFMIDADHILSARTVEDVVIKDKKTGEEKLLGTKVGQDVLSRDADTVSPLQRALDYEITQTLFVGRNTLLVEGESELLYLKWFSQQLQRAGKNGLDYRWNICIVKGIDRIPGFVSLFRGNGLNIVAVVDVQDGHKQKIDNVRQSLTPNHLLTADTYASQKEADIEDILGREFYIALVTAALGLRSPHELPVIKPSTAPARVVKEAEEFAALLPPPYPDFDHFVPAEWLFRNGDQGTALPGFSFALERMEKLIADVNNLRA